VLQELQNVAQCLRLNRDLEIMCEIPFSILNRLELGGYYMYRQFNIQQFYVLPTQYIYVFCVDVRTNSDCFPIQH
jgi:hypothetical protein